nr:MAG TPA: hypothetical protein [Caudoviricetes sp.]
MNKAVKSRGVFGLSFVWPKGKEFRIWHIYL